MLLFSFVIGEKRELETRPPVFHVFVWTAWLESSAHSLYGQITSELHFAQLHGFTGRGRWSRLPRKSYAWWLEHLCGSWLWLVQKNTESFPLPPQVLWHQTAVKAMQFLPPAPVGGEKALPSFFFENVGPIFSRGSRLKIYSLKSIFQQVWEAEFKMYSFTQYFL